MTIFLSHATADDQIATQVADIFISNGVKIWIDHYNIKVGDDWNEEIQKALNSAESCIFLLSSKSCNSIECVNEWRTILSYGKPLYIALIEQIPSEDYPWRLRTIHYVDLTINFDQGSTTLSEAIKQQSPLNMSYPNVKVATFLDVEKSNLLDHEMLKVVEQVRQYWIQEVLEKNLAWGDIQLPIAPAPKVLLHSPALEDNTLEGKGAKHLFNIYNREKRLLILGEPGAGKTTVALQLIRLVLDHIDANPKSKHHIPLFLNLSSWGSYTVTKKELKQLEIVPQDKIRYKELKDKKKYHLSIAAWIVKELVDEYGVEQRIAIRWVMEGRLALFLDGFDEVAQSLWEKCLKEINLFADWEIYGTHAMVMCSRIAEYDNVKQHLDSRIHMDRFVEVRTLSEDEVIQYLSEIDAYNIISLLGDESFSKPLASNPFWLSMMIRVYSEGRKIESVTSVSERMKTILDRYTNSLPIPKKYIEPLAEAMVNSNASIFYKARIQNTIGEALQKVFLDSVKESFSFSFDFSSVFSTKSYIKSAKNIDSKKIGQRMIGDGDLNDGLISKVWKMAKNKTVDIKNLDFKDKFFLFEILLQLGSPIIEAIFGLIVDFAMGVVNVGVDINDSVQERKRARQEARQKAKDEYQTVIATMVSCGVMHRVGTGYMFRHDNIRQYYAGNYDTL